MLMTQYTIVLCVWHQILHLMDYGSKNISGVNDTLQDCPLCTTAPV